MQRFPVACDMHMVAARKRGKEIGTKWKTRVSTHAARVHCAVHPFGRQKTKYAAVTHRHTINITNCNWCRWHGITYIYMFRLRTISWWQCRMRKNINSPPQCRQLVSIFAFVVCHLQIVSNNFRPPRMWHYLLLPILNWAKLISFVLNFLCDFVVAAVAAAAVADVVAMTIRLQGNHSKKKKKDVILILFCQKHSTTHYRCDLFPFCSIEYFPCRFVTLIGKHDFTVDRIQSNGQQLVNAMAVMKIAWIFYNLKCVWIIDEHTWGREKEHTNRENHAQFSRR